MGKISFLAYEINFSDVSEIPPVCLRNNLSENLLPYGDREVGQDFADFVYEIFSLVELRRLNECRRLLPAFCCLFCFLCWSALFNDSRQLIDKCWRNFASLFCTIADFDGVGELG